MKETLYGFVSYIQSRKIKQNRSPGWKLHTRAGKIRTWKVLWKNFAVQAKATDQEIKILAKIIKQTLNTMEILTVTNRKYYKLRQNLK
jgi:hypothetical protein